MQEDVKHRTVTLAISTTKMTGRLLKWAISKYLAHRKQKKLEKSRDSPVKYCGKQSLKQLKQKEPNLANIEISDKNIGDFDRVARKYRVDYALKKDKSGPIPKYYVFFKAKDSASLDAAFQEYSSRVTRSKNRPSVIQKLRRVMSLAPELTPNRERQKDRGAER